MILVTGAMGRIGTATVAALQGSGHPVRAMVPARRRVPWLADLGAELVEGDYDDGRRLGEALAGVEAVVLIARAGAEHVQLQERVIDACVSSGVQRLVKLSVAGAAPDAPADAARWHWRTEQHLRHASVAHAIVRAGRTMQDLQYQVPLLLSHAMLVSCQGDGVSADPDTRDVGGVLAALALADQLPSDPVHVTGPELLSRHAVAETLGRAVGFPVRTVPCTPGDLAQLLQAAGLSGWQVEDLVAFEVAARDGHASTVTDAVARFTGRPARTFTAFANELGNALRYARAPEPAHAAPVGGVG